MGKGECGEKGMGGESCGGGGWEEVLVDGWGIGADGFLDERCWGSFSAYSNGNCPGDNMDFVNYIKRKNKKKQ